MYSTWGRNLPQPSSVYSKKYRHRRVNKFIVMGHWSNSKWQHQTLYYYYYYYYYYRILLIIVSIVIDWLMMYTLLIWIHTGITVASAYRMFSTFSSFRPLAGVWLSAIACQHRVQRSLALSFGRKWPSLKQWCTGQVVLQVLLLTDLILFSSHNCSAWNWWLIWKLYLDN